MLLYLPFAVQGLAILVDEFWFHHRRGLPRWERLGHPIDTLPLITLRPRHGIAMTLSRR